MATSEKSAELVDMAKLAEQAERYDDMVKVCIIPEISIQLLLLHV